ncbi:hypothetical protein UP17_12790 [Peribacillus simplex]|nr:hypothetical protein UP17_12790 [Peribacillus simplex]
MQMLKFLLTPSGTRVCYLGPDKKMYFWQGTATNSRVSNEQVWTGAFSPFGVPSFFSFGGTMNSLS